MKLMAQHTIDAIARAESPIERSLAQSLLLRAIAEGEIGLLVFPTGADAAAEVSEFRRMRADHFKHFGPWPREGLNELLNQSHVSGRMSHEDWRFYSSLLSRHKSALPERMYYLTIQPRFPRIKVSGRSIRADLYLWSPQRPDINMIVECDGFKYHSTAEKFTSDRQRERALEDNGYVVRHYSGSEIYRDPLQAASDLFASFQRSLGRPAARRQALLLEHGAAPFSSSSDQKPWCGREDSNFHGLPSAHPIGGVNHSSHFY